MMEETLFDITGTPIAYIVYDDDFTIYLWDGTPVAYLIEYVIFGFNGLHLGWYSNGVVRDVNGLITGFNARAADVYTKNEPFKSYKKYKPYKSYRQYIGMKPFFSWYKSRLNLYDQLSKGRI